MSETEKQKWARQVLFSMGDPCGYESGSFRAKLIDAAFLADHENLLLLKLVYPQMVIAVATCRFAGLDQLHEMAGCSHER